MGRLEGGLVGGFSPLLIGALTISSHEAADNAQLGSITVKTPGGQTVFVWDGGESRMAMRKNDDGTISFVNADPPLSGFEFVKGNKEGKRTLIGRDAQHEYVFIEVS
jgi:hypothetical protein